MYGLSAYEDRVVASMPRYMRYVVADALNDRESAADIRQILQSSNPVARLHHEIQSATREALIESGVRPAGMSDYYNPYIDAGMGSLKKKLKKIVKKVVAPVKKIHDKIADKILPQKLSNLMSRTREKISNAHSRLAAKNKKVFLRYGQIVLPIVGAVLAPFTGGASLAAAAVLVTGIQVYKQKEAAEAAKRAGKAEANAMAAAVAQQEAELHTQADNLYNQYQGTFLAFGLTPDKWQALTITQKLEIIDALSKGELPAGYTLISEEEAAAAGAVSTQAGATQQALRPAPVASAPAPMVHAASKPYTPAPGYTPTAGPTEVPPDMIEVILNGRPIKVASVDAAMSVAKGASVGDRVEVTVNGESMGLKLMTKAGLIDVPPEAADRVRAMTQEDAVGLASRAGAQAEAPGQSKFSWWWLLAVPAALVAAKAA